MTKILLNNLSDVVLKSWYNNFIRYEDVTYFIRREDVNEILLNNLSDVCT